MNKLFKNLKDKVDSFYSTEGTDLDKDIFINSDQRLLKVASSIIVLTSFLGIGWLALAKTDEIIIVPGKIIPIGKVKEIKMPMSGVIEKIEIKEGDLVYEKQVLMRIESDTNSNLSTTLENSIKIKKQQIESLNSQILNTQEIYNKNKNILKDKIDIYQNITDKYQTLLDEGAISELNFLEQKTKLQSLKSDLLQYEMDWATKSKSQELQMQELKNSLNQLKGELEENDLNLGKKSINSPVNGYIFDLKPVASGYSAQMTETIVKIVPMGDLIAYLEIPSSDIGFVKEGMDVEISIDSYPSTDFGIIEGTITSIGTDALEPDPSEQRNQFVYPARIELKSQKLKLRRGKQLDLKVGMSLQGNIKLRKVSYLQLLFTNFKDKTKSIQEL
ncbi:HlyD family secretion protein [Prochlorococcus marinus]|uniref:AprE-like beta-barrel domain-containing protein n=1 Tax=Prochlorococcus marinus (strain AS9601) TaxID=146891 RepID=A2BSF4_PROMS|nr:HlyD family efflux transporter periplasmic adaptor subunit [Prochlorococcus marinus]ABM70715.1 Hypothetical protein A9601_14321 [Prochlorococcus marinus str. AS9601]